jgi:hypothetical protein
MTSLLDMHDALLQMWRRDPVYAYTLCGPRTRGSTTTEPLFSGSDGDGSAPVLVVQDREVVPVAGAVNGAQAYQCAVAEIGGRLGAVRYGSLTVQERERAFVRDGEHGPELAMPGFVCFPPTHIITFIVGPDGCLWTWYPGPIMAPYSPEMGPQADTAVKLDCTVQSAAP